MGYKTELHCHSQEFSLCSHHSCKDIIDMYEEHGYSTIVLTNHLSYDYFGIYNESYEELVRHHYRAIEQMRECAGDRMNIISGTELRFRQSINDYLVYGLDEETLVSMKETFEMGVWRFHEAVEKLGALVIQAHPFRQGMTVINPAVLDGVEVYNGSHTEPMYNMQAKYLCDIYTEKKLIRTSGSDHHNADQMPKGGIITDTPITSSKELCEYLRAGSYTLIED